MKGLVLLIGSLALATSPTLAQDSNSSPTNWWEISHAARPQRPYSPAAMAAEFDRRPFRDSVPVRRILLQLDRCLDCGMEEDAMRLILVLKAKSPDLSVSILRGIFGQSLHKGADPRVAMALINAFPETLIDSWDDLFQWGFGNRLSSLLQCMVDHGWSLQQVKDWILSKPERKGQVWRIGFLDFAIEHQIEGDALELWFEPIRQNPGDYDAVQALLDAADAVHLSEAGKAAIPSKLGGLKDVTKWQAHRIAERLHSLKLFEAALPFDERAVQGELNAAALKELLDRYNTFSFDPREEEETARNWFKIQALERWSEHLLEVGQALEGQIAMVQAADLRESLGIRGNPGLAGMSQAASGVRTIEGRIKAREAAEADSPEYWKERAAYFRARRENAQWIEALEKGMESCSPSDEIYASFLRERALYLKHYDRVAEGLAMLRSELQKDAVGKDGTRRVAARTLWGMYGAELDGTDPVYWDWILSSDTWTSGQERFMRVLKARSGLTGCEEWIDKAEALAFSGHPSRAQEMGEFFMMQDDQEARAIPLLYYAMVHTPERERSGIDLHLFQAYLSVGDLDRATWLHAALSNQAEGAQPDYTGRFSRLAILAAQQGKRERALSMWKQVIAYDPSVLKPLKQLVKAGLETNLLEIYAEFEEHLPQSNIPDRARAQIAAK